MAKTEKAHCQNETDLAFGELLIEYSAALKEGGLESPRAIQLRDQNPASLFQSAADFVDELHLNEELFLKEAARRLAANRQQSASAGHAADGLGAAGEALANP